MRIIYTYYYILIALLLSVVVGGCNRYDEILGVGRPVIEFDHADGIYTVSVGEELVLEPMVENAVNASYEWMMEDSTVVCTRSQWVSKWSRPGEYYVMLTVTAEGGIAREEIMIDVIDPQPPAISIAAPESGLLLGVGQRRVIAPLYGNCGEDGVPQSVEWNVDGEVVSHELSYSFESARAGVYNIIVSASNSVGTTRKELRVEVMDELPSDIRFVPLSSLTAGAVRYTVVGRPVGLQVAGRYDGDIVWRVDGAEVEGNGGYYRFVSDREGRYSVTAENRGCVSQIDVVVSREPAVGAIASMQSPVRVLEYLPAPGQFIGESNSIGGMPVDVATLPAACVWAENRLALNRFVSLGAWGGYIVCALDGSIVSHGRGYDFAIMGNAILTSNEPGIVWVMQDVNGNGLPDDQWYELRGSEFGDVSTDHCWSVDYYRPAADGMPVQWTAPDGESRVVEYLPSAHSQPSYFPAWAEGGVLTFYGSRLKSRTFYDQSAGLWDSPPFGWGYADNLGSNIVDDPADSGTAGQWAGFRIADAVLPDGTPVALSHIDFVKIQTGVMATAGRVGEVSTEVCGLRALGGS